MRCMVLNCKSCNYARPGEISFFSFPANPALRKRWIKFCRQDEPFNPRTSYICMRHFKIEDIENNLKYEMGFTKKRLLRRNTVPSIFDPDDDIDVLQEKRVERIERRENKKIVEQLLKEYDAALEKDMEDLQSIEQEELTETVIERKQSENNEVQLLEQTDEENVPPNNEEHFKTQFIDENEFDTTKNVHFVDVTTEVRTIKVPQPPLPPKGPYKKKEKKSIGVQTIKNNIKHACGFIHVNKDYKSFTMKCYYCKESFKIWHWANFVQHIKENHRENDDEDDVRIDDNVQLQQLDEMDEQNETNEYSELDLDYYIEEVPEDMEEGDYEELDENNEESLSTEIFDEYNEYEEADHEADATMEAEYIEESDELVENSHPSVSSLTKNDEGMAEPKTNESSEQLMTEQTDVPEYAFQDLIDEVNVQTTDPAIVLSFLAAIETEPILWYLPEIVPKYCRLLLLEFIQAFNEKHHLAITEKGLRKSLSNIYVWYQNVFNRSDAEFLTYPECDYYEKCTEILSDQSNGAKTCNICDKQLNDYMQFSIHRKEKHEINDCKIPTDQIEKYLRIRWHRCASYECRVCDRKYIRLYNYVEHMKAHEDIRDNVCHLCGKGFVRHVGLVIHLSRHRKANKKCSICNKFFGDYSVLAQHRRKHHRPIEGTIEEIEESLQDQRRTKFPNSRYTTKFNAKTKTKCYGCNFCDNVYRHDSGLYRHIRTCHRDEYKLLQMRARHKKVRKPSGIRKARVFKVEEDIPNKTSILDKVQ